jgi:hypothetical protein
LLPKVALYLMQLALESLHALVVLLEHQLVALVLRPRIEVLLLELGQPALCLPLRLLIPQGVLLHLLLLHQPPLLLFEIALRLELRLLLRVKRRLLLGLQHPLLLLVFPILPVDLALPKLVDLVGLVGFRCWRGSWPFLNLLFGARGKGRRILVFS